MLRPLVWCLVSEIYRRNICEMPQRQHEITVVCSVVRTLLCGSSQSFSLADALFLRETELMMNGSTPNLGMQVQSYGQSDTKHSPIVAQVIGFPCQAARALSAERDCNNSLLGVSLVFMDKMVLLAGRITRPAR